MSITAALIYIAVQQAVSLMRYGNFLEFNLKNAVYFVRKAKLVQRDYNFNKLILLSA